MIIFQYKMESIYWQKKGSMTLIICAQKKVNNSNKKIVFKLVIKWKITEKKGN